MANAQVTAQPPAARRLASRLKRATKEILSWSVPPASPQELRLLRTVRPYTMVPVPRLRTLWKLANRASADGMAGAFVECGSCNGGTGAILAHVAARDTRVVWLFDSFEGLPEPKPEDGERAKAWVGQCLGQEELVREVLSRVNAQTDRVKIVKGWFDHTLAPAQTGPIALLHLDADWYESTMTILNNFYDRVVPGGYLVFDDYGHWPGCRRALDEFLNTRGLRPALMPSDNEGIWFRKPVETRNGSAASA
ncbi:MAG: macrocin O-methyltransferase [Chloroflexi bacterium]|nr:MAG: macrocin O-methyltransferase [Chloroflexota bacterium]